MLITAFTTMFSCSDIDEGDRYIYVASIDSLLTQDTTQVIKHVLIEDFTGQRCVNCPDATSLIHTMQEAYGEENLIAVGIYSGPFGQTTSGRLYDLTTETGNYYFDQLGVSSQPVARINRHFANTVTSTWPNEVLEYIQQEAPMDLTLTNTYDESSRRVDISVEGLGLSYVSGRLQVWLMEDGIMDFQYQSDGSIEDEYIHEHVFRTTVNDRDGDAYSVSQGETAVRTFSYTLDDTWVADSMKVVAFVFDDSEVLQATVKRVVEKE